MTANVLAIVAASEGWSDENLVCLLYAFIEREGLEEALYDFLADRVASGDVFEEAA